MSLLYVLLVVAAVAIAIDTVNRRRTRDLRQSGLLPPTGQGTDADVERLVGLGRKIDAIKLYREIHSADLKTAKDAVDKIADRLTSQGMGGPRVP
jgi:ribosomal protein L7/L12